MKAEALPVTVREAYRLVRHRGSHIFWTVGSQMAVRLSILMIDHPSPPDKFPLFLYIRGWAINQKVAGSRPDEVKF
jgi:hypothetical protein